MDCFSMPKKSDEDKKKRDKAIEDATKNATLIPLSVLKNTIPSLKIAREVTEFGNKNSLSDAGVAALMAKAAAHGAYYNVLINLGTISDKSWVEKTRRDADTALADADKLSDVIQKEITKKLTK